MGKTARKPRSSKHPQKTSGDHVAKREGLTEEAAAEEPLGGDWRLIGGHIPIRGWAPALVLCALTLLLSGLIFAPVGWWPLAYLTLVPWLVLVCAAERGRRVYFVSYWLGLAFFLLNIRWMYQVTVPGYLTLCAFNAVFFPLAAWPIRHMYRRRRVSVALIAPVVWVATEYLRSIGPVGFPWLLLAHSHYQQLTMIQISDLVGAFGVSFVIAMVNGWITDLLIQPIFIRRGERPERATRLPLGSLTTLVIVAGTLIYGAAQTGSRNRLGPGPKVAVVQGDFGMYVDDRARRTRSDRMFQTYFELTRQAAETKPDLIVLPETPWQGFLNDGFLEGSKEALEEIRRLRYPRYTVQDLEQYRASCKRQRDAFIQLSAETGVTIVMGGQALEWKPTAIPPRVEVFNSSFLLNPSTSKPAARYDKVHLVLFGEYVPFRYKYHSVYEWLNSLTPWGRDGEEYSLTAGEGFHAFEFSAMSREGKRFRAGTPICYEEIMPYVSREFVRGPGGLGGGKNIDMLLSISNDGWFDHSSELEQHLAAAVFRAVENRIGVARSVNTGTSALVDPNGKIHHRVILSDAKKRSLEGLQTGLIELKDLAGKMVAAVGAKGGADASYRQAWMAFGQALNQRFAGQVQTAGLEFDFLRLRLSDLASHARPGPDDEVRTDAAVLLDQVDEDLRTLERWKEKPWTAPGYNIGEVRCDPRITFYTRWGDRFSQAMAGLAAVMLLDWFWRRLRRGRAAPAPG